MASNRYAIELLPSAMRQLEKLPRPERRIVMSAIDGLAIAPRPPDARLLSGTGSERIWRIALGAIRIMYQVYDQRLVILIVRVADRREAYRPADVKRLLKQLRGQE